MYIKHVNQEQVDYFKGRIKDTLLKTIRVQATFTLRKDCCSLLGIMKDCKENVRILRAKFNISINQE